MAAEQGRRVGRAAPARSKRLKIVPPNREKVSKVDVMVGPVEFILRINGKDFTFDEDSLQDFVDKAEEKLDALRDVL